jgi:hypothetical protein
MLNKLHELEELLATNDPEMDAILQDVLNLDSEGKLDDAAGKEIQRRIQNKSTSEKVVGTITRPSVPKPQTLPKKFRFPVLAILFLVVVGALLEGIIGKHFIFSAINDYWQFSPWIIGLLTPVFSWGLFLLVKNDHFIKSRYPT